MFTERWSDGQNMNNLQYFQMKLRVWRAQYREQVHTKILSTVLIIVVWCCCCYWRADSKTSVLNEEVLRKRVFDGFPNLFCPERWSGLNRISHWVKLCVDPNGRIKLLVQQNYEILFATYYFDIISNTIFFPS